MDKRVPDVRFKGFTDDWELCKLENIFDIIDGDRGKNYPGENDFFKTGTTLFLDTGNVKKTGFDFSTCKYITNDKDNALKNGKLELYDFVMTSRGTLGNIAYYDQNTYTKHASMRINSAMLILRPILRKSISDYYMESVLRGHIIDDFIKRKHVGSAQPHITKKDFSKVEIGIPESIDEQKKIGNIINLFNNWVALQQDQLRLYEDLRKGFLQKLFPSNVEKIPKIRFNGFNEVWKYRKLNEYVSFLNGRAFKQEELLNKGKYKVLRVGNFNTNDQWYYSNLKLEKDKYAENGDLLYLWATNFGPEIWHSEKVIYHYHIWKIKIHSKSIDKMYLYNWLEKDKNNISQDLNGTTMVHITKNNMENRILEIPNNILEQKKIGKILIHLDILINIEKEKVKELKFMKKYYLQKLFI